MHPKFILRMLRLLTIIIPAIVLAGCFGGGSGTAPIRGTALGVLMNSPIEGADYTTATQSGVTNAKGEFRYVPGEMVTFSFGGIVLGTAAGAPIVTPVELTGNANIGPGTETNPNAATNQLVFLQSIDEDQTTAGYANGISIGPGTRAAATTLNLDFNDRMAVETVINTIAPMGNSLVTNKAALDNFYRSYRTAGGGITFPWPFPDYAIFPGPPVELLANGTFEADDASGGNVNGASGWSTFEFVLTNNTAGPGFGPVSHDAGGMQSLTMFGPFRVFPEPDASGAFQRVPGVPGATYNLSAWVMNWSGDPLGRGNAPPPATPNLGILQLNFLDADGNQIDGAEATVNPSTLPEQDGAQISDWTRLSLSAVAPAGTVAVEVFMLHVQITPVSGGSIFWDDVSLIGPSGVPFFKSVVWEDDFNGTALDLTKWTYEYDYGPDPNNQGWGNDEWQRYTDDPNNISVANGNLVISAQLNTAQCSRPTGPPPGGCGKRDGSITSARITTVRSGSQGFSFKYGKIEASIKLPVGGYGTWPAFWMLGENLNATPPVIWPKAGEIDIVEMFNREIFGINTESNQEAVFTMHWCDETVMPGAPVCFPAANGYKFDSGTGNLGVPGVPGVPLGDDFHVYAAVWDANGVTWSIDGNFWKYTLIQPATMEEFLENFFIILNVAIGGNPFITAPDDKGWPRTMLVDWVRVYQ